MRSLYGQKTEERLSCSRGTCTLLLVLLGIALFLGFFYAFYKGNQPYPISQTLRFQTPVKKVCATSSLLEYEGVLSFFKYLEKPQHTCPNWREIGSDKEAYNVSIDGFTGRDDTETAIGIASEYVCITEQDDDVTQKPCFVYAFTMSSQGNGEKRLQSLGCKLHVFPLEKEQKPDVTMSSQNNSSEDNTIRGLGFRHNESDITLSGFDPIEISEAKSSQEVAKRHARDITIPDLDKERSRTMRIQKVSLDKIALALGHQGQKISLVKVDASGVEWSILRQIVDLKDMVEVQQISAKISVPSEVGLMSEIERYLFFADLFKVFQDLNCLGYKLIKSLPLASENSDLILEELKNQSVPRSYQVNWIRVKN